MTDTLLAKDEPHPFLMENAEGRSAVVLVCEHGGRRFPRALDHLGLSGAELAKHFVWDVGALRLARALAMRLDAPLLHQRYSRLVCDGNRRPDMPSFIPDQGEGIPVPGNRAVSDEERAQRTREVWQPFHASVAATLDERQRRGLPTLLVSIHSFTPVFHGKARPWKVGVLYDRDTRLSPALLQHLRQRFGDEVGDNEPYRLGRDSDYTIPVHGEDRGLPSAEIEVRHDLLSTPHEVAAWATILAEALRQAAARSGLPLEI